MHHTHDHRIANLKRTNRRYRLSLLALATALAGSIMVGQSGANEEPSIDGFTAVMDRQGGMSYFRLVDRDTVQILDTSRPDRWYWRRIRNWPDEK